MVVAAITTIKGVGYRHTHEGILEGAVAVAFDDGLSGLSFGKVAARLGTSDRIVVYYFPSKDDLIGAVLGALGARLQETLAPTLTSKAADHVALVRAAWPIVAHPTADPVFALFFEALGLAASGREPYKRLVPALVTGWIDWASGYITGSVARRRAEAEGAIAVLDGLLLLRQLAGPDAADRAARQIGVASRGTQRGATRT
ncbi:MAG: putative TetR family transcriptional regulator [Ilumatobacteraceae bacterium]|nr:putative TetR family transcriptional regulator [Ilumatobacteraceae bacterium]